MGQALTGMDGRFQQDSNYRIGRKEDQVTDLGYCWYVENGINA